MKKSIFIVSGLCALSLAAGVMLTLAKENAREAQASAQNVTIVKDNFNGAAYAGDYNPEKWLHTGEKSIKQTEESESFFYNPGSSTDYCGENMFYGTKEVITNLQYVQFDLKFYENAYWIGIKFNKQITGPNGISAYNGPVMIYPKQLVYFMQEPDITLEHKPEGYSPDSLSWATGVPDEIGVWLTFRFEPIDETHMKAFVVRQGQEFDPELYLVYKLNNQNNFNFLNTQFGFQGCDKCKYAIDNLMIKGDNIDLVEDYSSEWEDEDNNPMVVQTNNGRGGYEYTGDSHLEFYEGSALGDKLLAKRPVKEDTSLSQTVRVIDATFTLAFDENADIDEKVAFVFGLNDSGVTLENASGAIIFDKANAVIRIPGQEDVNCALPPEITGENGLVVNIGVIKNGTVKATFGEVTKTASGAKVQKGYTGFATVSDITHPVKVEDVTIKNTTYFVPVTKSVTHNFSNNFWGNEGYEDFYVTTAGVGDMHAENGKLKLSGCIDGCFFGSAYQYDAFILDYKLCSIYVETAYLTGDDEAADPDDRNHSKIHTWIGLDLSRSVKSYSSWGAYGMPHFEICPSTSSEFVHLQFYTREDSPLDQAEVAASIKRYQPIPTSYFRPLQYDGVLKQASEIKEEDYLCVRWVSDGTNLTLYLKTNGESEFTKYAMIPNLELNGYFALSNPGYLYCEYDDFSMANTSPLYICADNEAPETITETETVIIYDGANTDVNLLEELRLNSGGLLNILLTTTIVLGVTTLGASVALVVVLVVKKKKKTDA